MLKSRTVRSAPAKLSGAAPAAAAQGRLKAIVKVSRAGHVPEDVVLRARIDECLFTAEFDAAALERISSDPLVLSISAAQEVRAA